MSKKKGALILKLLVLGFFWRIVFCGRLSFDNQLFEVDVGSGRKLFQVNQAVDQQLEQQQQQQQIQQQANQNQNQQQQQNQGQSTFQAFQSSSGSGLQINPRTIRCAQGGYFSGMDIFYSTTQGATGASVTGVQITCSSGQAIVEGQGIVDNDHVFGQRSTQNTNVQCNNGVMIGLGGKQASNLDIQPVCCPLNDFKDPSKWVQPADSNTRSGNIYSSQTCTLGPETQTQTPWVNNGAQVQGYSITACPQTGTSSQVMAAMNMVFVDGQSITSIGIGSCREVQLMRSEAARVVKDITDSSKLVDAQCQGFPTNYCNNQQWTDTAQNNPIIPYQQSYYACELAGSRDTGLSGVSLPGVFFNSDTQTTNSRQFGSICGQDDDITAGWVQLQNTNQQVLDCTKESCTFVGRTQDSQGLAPKSRWFQTLAAGLIESGANPGFCVSKDGSSNPSGLQPCTNLQQQQASALSVFQGQQFSLLPVGGSNYTADATALQGLINQGRWEATAFDSCSSFSDGACTGKIPWNTEAIGGIATSATLKTAFLPAYCNFPGIVCNNANRIIQILIYTQSGNIALTGGSIGPAIYTFRELRAFAISQSSIAGIIPQLFDSAYSTNWSPINLRAFSLLGTNVEGTIPADWASKRNNEGIVPNLSYFMASQSRLSGVIPPEWLNQLPRSFVSITDNGQTCLYARTQSSQFLTDNGNSQLQKCTDSDSNKNFQVYTLTISDAASTSYRCPFCSTENTNRLKSGLDGLTQLASSQLQCYTEISDSGCQAKVTYANNGGNDASSQLSTSNVQNVLQTQNSVSVSKIDASSQSVSNAGNNNVNTNGGSGASGSSARGGAVEGMGQSSPGGNVAAGVIVAVVAVILFMPIFNWIQACILERAFISDWHTLLAIILGTYKAVPGIFYPPLFGYKMNPGATGASRGLLLGGRPAMSQDLGGRTDLENTGSRAIEVEGLPFRDFDSGADFLQVGLAIQQKARKDSPSQINWLTNAPILTGSGVNRDAGNKTPMFVVKSNQKYERHRLLIQVSSHNSSSTQTPGYSNLRVDNVTITQAKQIAVPHLSYNNVRAVNNYNKKVLGNKYFQKISFDTVNQSSDYVLGSINLELDLDREETVKKARNKQESVYELLVSVNVSVDTARNNNVHDAAKMTQEQQEYYNYLKSNNMFDAENQENEMSRVQAQNPYADGSKHFKLLVPMKYVVEPSGTILLHQRIYSLGFKRVQYGGSKLEGKQIGQLGQVLFFEPHSGQKYAAKPTYADRSESPQIYKDQDRNLDSQDRNLNSTQEYQHYPFNYNDAQQNTDTQNTDTQNNNTYGGGANNDRSYNNHGNGNGNGKYYDYNDVNSRENGLNDQRKLAVNKRELSGPQNSNLSQDLLKQLDSQLQLQVSGLPNNINSKYSGYSNHQNGQNLDSIEAMKQQRNGDHNNQGESKNYHNILYTTQTQNDMTSNNSTAKFERDIITKDSHNKMQENKNNSNIYSRDRAINTQDLMDSRNGTLVTPSETQYDINTKTNTLNSGSQIFSKVRNSFKKNNGMKGVKFMQSSDQPGEEDDSKKGGFMSKFQMGRPKDRSYDPNSAVVSRNGTQQKNHAQAQAMLNRDKSDFSGQSGMPLLILNPTNSNMESQNNSSTLQQQAEVSNYNNSSLMHAASQDATIDNENASYLENKTGGGNSYNTPRDSKIANLDVPPPLISGMDTQKNENGPLTYKDLIKTMETDDQGAGTLQRNISGDQGSLDKSNYQNGSNPLRNLKQSNSGKLEYNRNKNKGQYQSYSNPQLRKPKIGATQKDGTEALHTRNSGSLASGMRTNQLSTYTPNDYVMSRKIEEFLSSIPTNYQPKPDDSNRQLDKTISDIPSEVQYSLNKNESQNISKMPSDLEQQQAYVKQRSLSPGMRKYPSGEARQSDRSLRQGGMSPTDMQAGAKPPLPRNESNNYERQESAHYERQDSSQERSVKNFQDQENLQGVHDIFNKYINTHPEKLISNKDYDNIEQEYSNKDQSLVANEDRRSNRSNRSRSPNVPAQQEREDQSQNGSLKYRNGALNPNSAQNRELLQQHDSASLVDEQQQQPGDWRSLKNILDKKQGAVPVNGIQNQYGERQPSAGLEQTPYTSRKNQSSMDNRSSVGRNSSDLARQLRENPRLLAQDVTPQRLGYNNRAGSPVQQMPDLPEVQQQQNQYQNRKYQQQLVEDLKTQDNEKEYPLKTDTSEMQSPNDYFQPQTQTRSDKKYTLNSDMEKMDSESPRRQLETADKEVIREISYSASNVSHNAPEQSGQNKKSYNLGTPNQFKFNSPFSNIIDGHNVDTEELEDRPYMNGRNYNRQNSDSMQKEESIPLANDRQYSYQKSFNFDNKNTSSERFIMHGGSSNIGIQKSSSKEKNLANTNSLQLDDSNSLNDVKSYNISNNSSTSQERNNSINLDLSRSPKHQGGKPVGSFRDIVRGIVMKKGEQAMHENNNLRKSQKSTMEVQPEPSLATQQTNMSFSMVNSISHQQLDSPSHLQGVDSFSNHEIEVDLKNITKAQLTQQAIQKQIDDTYFKNGQVGRVPNVRSNNSQQYSEDGTQNSYDPKGVDIEFELESVSNIRNGSAKAHNYTIHIHQPKRKQIILQTVSSGTHQSSFKPILLGRRRADGFRIDWGRSQNREIQIDQPAGYYRGPGGNVSTVSWRSQTPSMYENDTEASPKASRQGAPGSQVATQKPPKGKARYGQIGQVPSKKNNFNKLKVLNNDDQSNMPQLNQEEQSIKHELEPVKKLIIKKPGQSYQGRDSSGGGNNMFMSFD